MSTADADPAEPPRVRLADVRVHRAPSGRQRVEVDLDAPDGRRVTGTFEDAPTATGDVRIAAEAALAALRAAVPAAPDLAVAGVKTLRAFDQTVTLVLIGAPGATPARLLGAACNEENVARAAAVAVLNATNRVRGRGPG